MGDSGHACAPDGHLRCLEIALTAIPRFADCTCGQKLCVRLGLLSRQDAPVKFRGTSSFRACHRVLRRLRLSCPRCSIQSLQYQSNRMECCVCATLLHSAVATLLGISSLPPLDHGLSSSRDLRTDRCPMLPEGGSNGGSLVSSDFRQQGGEFQKLRRGSRASADGGWQGILSSRTKEPHDINSSHDD